MNVDLVKTYETREKMVMSIDGQLMDVYVNGVLVDVNRINL